MQWELKEEFRCGHLFSGNHSQESFIKTHCSIFLTLTKCSKALSARISSKRRRTLNGYVFYILILESSHSTAAATG